MRRLNNTFNDTIWTNCKKCNKLYIWNREKMKKYNYKYRCSECGYINTIPQKDIDFNGDSDE